MKALFLECDMGIAGDMLMSALFDLFENKEEIINKINSLNIPNTNITFTYDENCGIYGAKARVVVSNQEEDDCCHHHSHTHMTLNDVLNIIDSLNAPNQVKSNAKEIYSIIANAESKVHNTTVSQVHFHELGMMDAIADITVCCLLINLLDAEKIIVSPINVGNGSVKCAHGVLPVPAPATAEILKGVPYYKGNINSELCTPTGAALVKYFATDYNTMPIMNVKKIGYGFGKKSFEQANVIRAFYGESDALADEEIVELACNVDDMTGEEISFACEKLFALGAADVFTESVYMKKSRIGTKITVLCSKDIKSNIISAIFKHTKTIGIREYNINRYTLKREFKTVDTSLGSIFVKCSKGYGTEKMKYEFEDLRNIALENDLSIDEVIKKINNENL